MNPQQRTVTAPQGFSAAGVAAGIKHGSSDKKDMALLYSKVPAKAGGVFTKNVVKAAPVLYNSELVQKGNPVQAVIVNSGNANACTGPQGLADAARMGALTAEKLGLPAADAVLVASTGVIGHPLPMDRIEAGIAAAVAGLGPNNGHDAALAIMTTDLRAKETAAAYEWEGKTVTIGGIAKGSGMIHPNMGTMLAFLTTDAALSAAMVQRAVREATDATFNMVSVDGDSSTNDTCLLLANGLAGPAEITEDGPAYQAFLSRLLTVCTTLAKAIARDGEGATHLLEVEVTGAPDTAAARTIARSVTASNLVKTAIFGQDANWGRILCAAGYAGTDFDPAKIDIFLSSKAGTEQMAANGGGLAFDEVKAKAILAEEEIVIRIDLHQGEGHAKAWGCDFSYDYVKINADYRT